MSDIARVRTALTGFQGAPGVSTHYFTDYAFGVVDLRAWWAAQVARLPTGFHAQVENTGDIIDDATGTITGSWTHDAVADVAGTDTANYASAQGILFNWHTEDISDGRRIRGKTFVVPVSTDQIDGTGLLVGSNAAALAAMGTTLIAAHTDNLLIWHRPRKARAADGSRPEVTARAGGSFVVTACTVPRKLCILRSRRD